MTEKRLPSALRQRARFLREALPHAMEAPELPPPSHAEILSPASGKAHASASDSPSSLRLSETIQLQEKKDDVTRSGEPVTAPSDVHAANDEAKS
jgi:hypothetical protein